jgi:hypothetical protein
MVQGIAARDAETAEAKSGDKPDYLKNWGEGASGVAWPTPE